MNYIAGLLRIISYLVIFVAGVQVGHGGADTGWWPAVLLAIGTVMASMASVLGEYHRLNGIEE